MYSFGIVGVDQNGEWDELVSNNGASGFMQCSFWAAYKQSMGVKVYRVGLYDDDRLSAGATVMKYHLMDGYNYLYVPQGPVMQYEKEDGCKFFNSLISEFNKLVDKETVFLRIEPRIFDVKPYMKLFIKSGYDNQPSSSLIADLRQSEDDLLRGMKQKGRYNIKIAERNGIIVKSFGDKSGLDVFYELYARSQLRNGVKPKPVDYFVRMWEAGRDSLRIFVAYFGEVPVATALVVLFGKEATYFFGGSSGEHREKMASFKLHREIMKWLRAGGFEKYDLWGVVPETMKDHSWYGFSKFKRSFGGEEVSYIGAYDFVYNKSVYYTL